MTRRSPLSLLGWLSGSFPVPVRTASAVARSAPQGRPPGWRGRRLVLGGREPGRTLAETGTNGGLSRAKRAAVSLLLLQAVLASGAPSAALAAAPGISSNAGSDPVVAAAIDEAAQRFALPRRWIVAVMQAESAGRTDAVSAKGAMGLLQLMPETWREMSTQLGLGDDAFEPRANVLAGAAYMRRMYDRFGAPGFLAAYNAGPRRYERYLLGDQPLPSETRAYVRRVTPLLGSSSVQAATPSISDWRASALFVTPGAALGAAGDAP